ncbi:trypsin-like serine peptidase [Streptomyces sp. NPDC015127]|uniref:trypsin-like serine peptidase n=1 Tax=Streptomyces sp. NPDC015127 TaxID=3364939 RepID=UPI0036F79E31
MRIHRTALLVATTAALALTPLTAQAAPKNQAKEPTGVTVSKETSTDREIREYWTPERLKNAKEYTPTNRGKHTTGPDAARTGSKKIFASANAVKPKTSTTTTTTTQMAAGEIAVAQEVPYTTGPSYSIVGKLFFKKPGATTESKCSASVIVSNNRNTLWTAGHCAHLGDGSGSAGFMNDMYFIPGYRDGSAPFGAWSVKYKIVNDDWMNNGDSFDADYAALVLNPHPTHGKLQDNVGALGYYFADNVEEYEDVYAAGYPGEGYNRTDIIGERMYYCYGNTVDAGPYDPFIDDRKEMDCDQGKGSSGGPWIWGKSTTNPRIIANFSHYENDPNTGLRADDDVFSSEYDSKSANTINTANTLS